MEIKCPEPGCGVDVSRAVKDALEEKRKGLEMMIASRPAQGGEPHRVLVSCPNGHWYWYP